MLLEAHIVDPFEQIPVQSLICEVHYQDKAALWLSSKGGMPSSAKSSFYYPLTSLEHLKHFFPLSGSLFSCFNSSALRND